MAKDDDIGITKAGITTNADGTRSIASSVRADGSVRKEIKIRPGYRPPEDIEKYKNRTAEAFRSKGKGGVLGAELVGEDKPKDPSAAASKNAKRREARKKAAAEKNDGDEKPAADMTNDSKQPVDEPKEVDAEAVQQKEVKKLVKKLRQAKDLKDKKESGAALLPEQFEKVIKINELIRQLDAMGFDSEGEKKTNGSEDAAALKP